MTDLSYRLLTSGALVLTPEVPTLKDLEEFCAKARSLGLLDHARLYTSRQGLFGPATNWHFDIPVIPKPPET